MCFVSGKLLFSYTYIMILIVLKKNGSLTLIWVGLLGVRSRFVRVCVCVCERRGGGCKITPCPKLIKVMHET